MTYREKALRASGPFIRHGLGENKFRSKALRHVGGKRYLYSQANQTLFSGMFGAAKYYHPKPLIPPRIVA